MSEVERLLALERRIAALQQQVRDQDREIERLRQQVAEARRGE